MKFIYTLLYAVFNDKHSFIPVYNASKQKRFYGKSFLSIAIVIALVISLPQIGFAGTCTWKGGAVGFPKNWNKTANWTGGIPIATSNIIIPAGLANYPTIPTNVGGASIILTANNISILATSGTVLTVPTGFTLEVAGSITTSGGLIDARSGTISMEGTAPQSIVGSYFVSSTIDNLFNGNADVVSGVSISNTLNITGQLSLGDYSILTTNNNLVLVSTASATAIVGPIDEDEVTGAALASIVGNITVQRYYAAHRRWRLITAPVQSSGAPTISAAWQEGGQSIAGSASNPAPGFGTDISGPRSGAFVSSTGYDQSANNSASIAKLTGANAWYSLPTTYIPVTSYQGYMIFVRGDRSFPIYTGTSSTLATSTILRTTGALNTGQVSVPVNSGFTVIGNPYAATINFDGIYESSTTALTSNSFSLWDPNIGSTDNLSTNGTGGWVTLSWNGTSYDASPDPSVYDGFDVNGDIQSGAAFAVDGAGSGSVVIDEFDKISDGTDNDTYLFRPTNNNKTLSQPATILRTTLYATDTAHAQTYLADGTLNVFGSNYTNNIDWSKDVKKLFNLTEKMSILKDSQNLSIEKSALPQAGDTVHLSMGNLKVSPYQLVIATKNFTRPDIKAFLIDSFTNISTPILLGDTSVTINFAVTSTPASSASNRFNIVFRAAPPIVAPVATATQASLINAYPNPVTNGTVNVALTNFPSGNYKIRIISEAGKVVLNETIYHGVNDSPVVIPFGNNVIPGIYIMEVIDPSGNKTKINLDNL